ncbi:MAG TPA: alkaline phosphatase D family protein, partial [Vicinamibacterales bacterium]|nr:alkaline phosphatase D family protein [Vicinamibacterales bacterium]
TDLSTINDPKRTLMGAAQEAWMFDQLRASQRADTRWAILGQQVMLSTITLPGTRVTNTDAWDGYPGQRTRVLDVIEHEKIRNMIVLTGDAHSSWGFDVARNPWNGYRATGEASLAVELVTPAISSPPPLTFSGPDGPEAAAAVRVAMPHLKYLDGARRGYVIVDLTPTLMRANWYFSPDVRVHSDAEVAGGALVCERGSAHLQSA